MQSMNLVTVVTDGERVMIRSTTGSQITVEMKDLPELITNLNMYAKKLGRAHRKTDQLPLLPDWMPVKQWEEYLHMRRLIKKPATPYAMQLAINKLEALKDVGHSPAAVLAQSTFYNYPGLYTVKEQK